MIISAEHKQELEQIREDLEQIGGVLQDLRNNWRDLDRFEAWEAMDCFGAIERRFERVIGEMEV